MGEPALTMEDYWLWLCSISGLYLPQQAALLRYFGSPREIFYAPSQELDRFRRSGLSWIRLVDQERTPERVLEIRRMLERKQIRFASCHHPVYPASFRQLPDAPKGVFYRGTLPGPEDFCVAIVGARACSAYGAQMAGQIAALAAEEGIGVVSGLAAGIDGIAQENALQAGGRSYGVLGCGVDVCYPKEHFGLYDALPASGGMLSEYPCGTRPLRPHFPQRNRLISALAQVVVVVEARSRSGSLITADLALDQGRDVYALPGRVGDSLSEGCNRLIAQGAGIITGAESFVEELLRMRDASRSAGTRCAKAPAAASPGALTQAETLRPAIAQPCKVQQADPRQSGSQQAATQNSAPQQADGQQSDPQQSGPQQSDPLTPDQQLILSCLGSDPVDAQQLILRTHLPLATLREALLMLQLQDRILEAGKDQYVRRLT